MKASSSSCSPVLAGLPEIPEGRPTAAARFKGALGPGARCSRHAARRQRKVGPCASEEGRSACSICTCLPERAHTALHKLLPPQLTVRIAVSCVAHRQTCSRSRARSPGQPAAGWTAVTSMTPAATPTSCASPCQRAACRSGGVTCGSAPSLAARSMSTAPRCAACRSPWGSQQRAADQQHAGCRHDQPALMGPEIHVPPKRTTHCADKEGRSVPWSQTTAQQWQLLVAVRHARRAKSPTAAPVIT